VNLKCRSFSGATHTKLIHISFTNNNATQLLQSLHSSSIKRRPVILEYSRTTGRRHISSTNIILDSNKNTGKRTNVFSGSNSAVEVICLGDDGLVIGEVEEGAEVWFSETEAREIGTSKVDGGEVAREERVAD
jgi:hypothetical protein